MITNYDELATNKLRKSALNILEEGITSVLPETIFSSHIRYKEDQLEIKGSSFKVEGGVYVIGGGKASAHMARALENIIPEEKIRNGLVNSVKNINTKKIRVNEASDSLPDEKSLEGVKQMLKMTDNLKKEDIVICLISGGGSLLLPYPVEGISLEDIRKMTGILQKAGVETYEIQYIRKHISGIKGGQLARRLQPAKVISIILSDVVNKKDICAAGPTEPDTSTFSDAYKVLEKYNVLDKVPISIREYLEKGVKGEKQETPKPQDDFFNNVHNLIIADKNTALNAMRKKAENLGFEVEILEPISGDAKKEAKRISKIFGISYKKKRGPFALIFSSEIFVKVKGRGRGGRNQEFNAALIEKIGDYKNCVHASIDSDGTDCIYSVAGAIIDNETRTEAAKKGVNIKKFLENNDSNSLHEMLKSLIYMKPTGTNIGDIHVYLQEVI